MNFREPPHAKSGTMGAFLYTLATKPCCLTLQVTRLEPTLCSSWKTPNWSVPTVRSAPCPPTNSLVWLVHPGQNEKVRPRRRGDVRAGPRCYLQTLTPRPLSVVNER
jgi:hypothetical protein